MKRILFSLLASGFYVGAMAVPAKPGFVSFTQPDGTVIKIMMVGDEYGHMIYSEGGLLLVDVEGVLEYAQFDKNGYPQGSGIIAKADNEHLARSLMLQTDESLEKWAEKLNAERNSLISEKTVQREVAKRLEEGEDKNRLVPMNFGRWNVTFPVFGEQKGLVILVEYQDVEFQYGDYDYFNRMLNEEGFSDHGSLGSARDWFISNSNGHFRPEFDVYGPVKLPNDRRHYGKNIQSGRDNRAYEMAIHACNLLDEEVDFSQYDRDNDGLIDNVFIFYAGEGEHESGIADTVWPHSWDVMSAAPNATYLFDGVQLNHYACSCEHPLRYDRADGIGTFVHEFSHVMGLPDLYVTEYNGGNVPFTPGPWSVLDYGSYNNDGLTPPNYSSYERCALGWLEFQPFTAGQMEIPELSLTNVAYALPTENSTEFYFFENRQQQGNDEFLPGHGMLVWHIDYRESAWEANKINNVDIRQFIDLVEADNERTDETRAGDTFPGTENITSFGFTTRPKLASWNKKRLAFDLEDVTESEDGVITFNAVMQENAVEEVCIEKDENAAYYDLMGRRVTNPDKGIYVRNGKKVIVL